MKISPVKRKLNLIDEIAQIENTKSKNLNTTTNDSKLKNSTDQNWFDALNDHNNSQV
jgi:hypothetical protein